MLHHPSILKVYGIFLSDEKNPPSILMEKCEYNIYEAIKTNKLTKIDIGFTIYKIAEGMRYTHYMKIIHRDLKPSNILICSNGTIKICDFGISKLVSFSKQQSATNTIISLYFTAPEILNKKRCTEKADVYSFGVLMFFILNGEIPNISIAEYVQGEYQRT